MNEEHVDKFVEEDLNRFERMLIPGYLYDKTVCQLVEKTVGQDAEGKPINDFADPINEVLYKAIKVYHQTTNYCMSPDITILNGILERFAIHEAGQHPLTVDMIPQALNRLLEQSQSLHDQWITWTPILRQGLRAWLTAKRMQTMMGRKRAQNLSTDRFMEAWGREATYLKLALKQDTSSRWESIWDCLNVQADPIFLNTPWEDVNAALGGGFARGDATIMVSHTGGGKTVAACQLAGHFVLRNHANGIIITTEQKGYLILPRMVSCYANIPYNRFSKDRAMNLEALDPIARANAVDFLKACYDRQFHFFHWDPDMPIREGFIDLVKDYIDRICSEKRIDFVVMDWLGGRLTHGVQGDEERHRMQMAGDVVAALADDYNIVTVATAQGSQSAQGKVQVGSAHLAECKTLHRYFENLIGISNIMVQPTPDQLADPGFRPGNKFQNEQFFNIEKCRYGSGGLVRVNRRFEFQKFD